MGPSCGRSRLSLLPAYALPYGSLPPSFACALSRGKPGSESRSTGSNVCRHSRGNCLSTPGVLGSGVSYVVSLHHSLYDPMRQSHRHAATSSITLIRSAFAVRERLGDPWDLPYFHCSSFHACHRPYPGGPLPSVPLCFRQRFQASSKSERVATHHHRLCQQCLTDPLISELHRSLYATARMFA